MRLILLTIFLSILFPLYTYSQWILQQTGTSEPIRDIEFINERTGWACANNGIILKTLNGGLNWIIQPTEANGKPLFKLYPIDSNIVYCVGWFETILKTTNGGTNWISLQNGQIGKGESYYSTFFINQFTGWISSNSQVLKTTNGGLNWLNIQYAATMRDIYFKDSLNGIGVSWSGIVSKTINSGLNWTWEQIDNGDIYRISILNDKTTGFIAVAGSNILYKTTNFGISWDSISYIPNVTEYIFCSEFITDSVGWVGGSHELFRTTNAGKQWFRQNIPIGFTSSIYAVNTNYVWTCGTQGRIFHTTNGGDTIVSIKQISQEIPNNFQLKQNYPNPFNPSTKISFSIPSTVSGEMSNIMLIIYDINGREIEILVNEKLRAGEYQVEWNANEYSSGVYFYSLRTESIKETKRMILLK